MWNQTLFYLTLITLITVASSLSLMVYNIHVQSIFDNIGVIVDKLHTPYILFINGVFDANSRSYVESYLVNRNLYINSSIEDIIQGITMDWVNNYLKYNYRELYEYIISSRVKIEITELGYSPINLTGVKGVYIVRILSEDLEIWLTIDLRVGNVTRYSIHVNGGTDSVLTKIIERYSADNFTIIKSVFQKLVDNIESEFRVKLKIRDYDVFEGRSWDGKKIVNYGEDVDYNIITPHDGIRIAKLYTRRLGVKSLSATWSFYRYNRSDGSAGLRLSTNLPSLYHTLRSLNVKDLIKNPPEWRISEEEAGEIIHEALGINKEKICLTKYYVYTGLNKTFRPIYLYKEVKSYDCEYTETIVAIVLADTGEYVIGKYRDPLYCIPGMVSTKAKTISQLNSRTLRQTNTINGYTQVEEDSEDSKELFLTITETPMNISNNSSMTIIIENHSIIRHSSYVYIILEFILIILVITLLILYLIIKQKSYF